MSGLLDFKPENRFDPGKGRLLVSEPFLPDPYFRRTVVLLCDHNAEGSFGFVLNRGMDLTINDLMEDLPPISSRVGIGGPVQSGELYYLHTLGKHVEGSVEVIDGVHMGGDYAQLRAMLATDPKLSKHVRFFVGYSGWGPDQLKKEMDDQAWMVAPADKRRIMGTSNEEMWRMTLKSMGREFAPLANFPEDPSLN
ncbi:MAG: YqgE/AlgH family protein [Flavobacteriales bacterium]|nr:YqgE/AlgH family protein [Flavobacteriales bacterium]